MLVVICQIIKNVKLTNDIIIYSNKKFIYLQK